LINAIVNLIVSLVLAASGAGLWSLLGGFIAGSLVQVALLWHLATFAPDCASSRRRCGSTCDSAGRCT